MPQRTASSHPPSPRSWSPTGQAVIQNLISFLKDEGIQRDMDLYFAPLTSDGITQGRDAATQRLNNILGFTHCVRELLINLAHIIDTPPPSRRTSGGDRNSNPCKRCRKDRKKCLFNEIASGCARCITHKYFCEKSTIGTDVTQSSPSTGGLDIQSEFQVLFQEVNDDVNLSEVPRMNAKNSRIQSPIFHRSNPGQSYTGDPESQPPPLRIPAHMTQNLDLSVDRHLSYQQSPQALIQRPIPAQYQSSAPIGHPLVESAEIPTRIGQVNSNSLEMAEMEGFLAWWSGAQVSRESQAGIS